MVSFSSSSSGPEILVKHLVNNRDYSVVVQQATVNKARPTESSSCSHPAIERSRPVEAPLCKPFSPLSCLIIKQPTVNRFGASLRSCSKLEAVLQFCSLNPWWILFKALPGSVLDRRETNGSAGTSLRADASSLPLSSKPVTLIEPTARNPPAESRCCGKHSAQLAYLNDTQTIKAAQFIPFSFSTTFQRALSFIIYRTRSSLFRRRKAFMITF